MCKVNEESVCVNAHKCENRCKNKNSQTGQSAQGDSQEQGQGIQEHPVVLSASLASRIDSDRTS